MMSFQAWADDPIPPSKLLRCKTLFAVFLEGTVPKRSPEITKSITELQREVKGLNYGGIVTWQLDEMADLNRNLVRYDEVDELGYAMPAYDKSQKLGNAVVDAKKIRFAQITAQNDSAGGYTVINNAHSLKNGSLKTTDLPKLRVWKDVNGNIWTLDHRRLAAMRLSGVVDKLEVEFVAEEVVRAQRFKYSSPTDGKSMMLIFKQPEERKSLAIVIMSDEFKQEALQNILQHKSPFQTKLTAPTTTKNSLNSLIGRLPEKERNQWIAARGQEHIEKIRAYAHEVSKSLKALERRTANDIKAGYQDFGKVLVRGKEEDSILAKLLRKDFESYQKGEEGINSVKKVTAALGDGIGTRVIMKTTPDGKIPPETIQGFVDKISSDIRNGVRVTEIINYRVIGKDGLPYLSDKQIDQIVRADREYRMALQKEMDAGKSVTVPDPIIVKSSPNTGFENGYTSFHMNIQSKSGIQTELQLRGPSIHQYSEVKHLFYDIKAGKAIKEEYRKNPKIMKAVNSYKSLSESDKTRMDNYFKEQMVHARNVEAGIKSAEPKIPPGIPLELSFENLKPILLHD